MLRLLACAGHGSTMWVTLFTATASPASKLTVSRRSRYMSVHAPVRRVQARAAIWAPRLQSIRRMVLSLADVEDVAERSRAAVDASLEAVLHRFGDFCLPEQEEIRIVGGPRAVERRAQHVTGTCRAHEARRHDDDEVCFLLLVRGAAGQRTEHRHVGKPGELLLVLRIDALQQAGDREA